MRPSSSFSHALRALVDLALHQARGPVPLKAIARRQGIPLPSLEQLFNRLRRKGIVEAERGPRGGYRLSRPPSRIAVRTVFEALDLGRGRPAAGDGDPAAEVWSQVEKAVRTTLEATTLEHLAAQARGRAEASLPHRFTFHI